MKGVILAGGFGKRMWPVTKAVNKHLLPIFNKPLIYFGIEKLVNAGIDKIMIVTSPEHIQDFVSLLGSGQDFKSIRTGKQIQIVYGIQNEASGIAQGLWIAKDYIGADDCVLYLGDNIFEDAFDSYINEFKGGATIFLKEVRNPHQFGIAELDKEGNVIEINEKPVNPKSNLAVTGIYIYDNTVFDKMIGQPVSARGEYEITYINNLYIKEGTLKSIKLSGRWFDAGTFESLLEASIYFKENGFNVKK